MKKKKEIKGMLNELQGLRKSALLKVFSTQQGQSLIYDTDIVRDVEQIHITINALQWVLNEKQ